MYPFPQNISPAVRTHVDAQTAVLNDMSKSLFKSFQQMCDLNIQLMQAMIEETALAGKQVLSADRTTRALADEVARDATEQTERSLRAQQESVRQFADPFARSGDGAEGANAAQGGQPHIERGAQQASSQGGQRGATTH